MLVVWVTNLGPRSWPGKPDWRTAASWTRSVSTVTTWHVRCELATAMGHDVDQPRNLAKSVTGE